MEDYPELEEDQYFPEDNDGVLETFGKGIVKGFLNVGAGAVGTAEFLAELTPWVGEDNFLEQMRANIRAEEVNFETDPQGAMEWAASVVGQALPYMGAAMTGHAYAGVLGAGGVGFAVEGQDAYEAAKKRGATEGQANWERGIVGAVNAAIEAVQMGRLFKFTQKGKHTFKAFKRLASQRAFKQMAQEGVAFSKDILLNSIEEAAEEFLQEGVSLTVPYYVEGREEFGDVDYFRHMWRNRERLGAAALGGAVVSPFLGIARAAIPTLAGPGEAQFQKMRDDIQARDISNTQKAAYLYEVDKLAERVLGYIPEEVKEIHPENKQAQKEHASIIDRMRDVRHRWEETREEHEAKIKKEQKERFGEAQNFAKETLDNPNLSPVARMAMAKSFIKGRMGKQYETLLEEDFTVQEYHTLVDAVMRAHQDSITDMMKAYSALEKMFVGEDVDGQKKGILPEKNELKALEPILGKTFVKETIETIDKIKTKPLTRGEKILGQIRELFNFPRAVLASLDFSAIGRQGALMAFMKPGAWLKGAGAGYRAFFNEDYADYIDLLIKTHPHYKLMKESGVLEASEEFFASSLAHRLPGIRASERAYVTSLNVMRAQAFYSIASDWVGTGKTADFKELGY
jgi:hypothetical protein